MSIFHKLSILLMGMAFFIAGFAGCGASGNDQGTSFLALGFFEDGTGDAGDVGTVVLLNQDIPAQQGVSPLFVPIDKNVTEDGIQGGFIGLENRLTSQFLRTVRIDCSYFVQGADASLSIPDDSFNFTTVLGPAPEAGAEGESTNRAFVQVLIASPDIISFLSVNQNRLPELPFRMNAICSVIGISQAGDVIETNPVNYEIIFAESAECCRGDGPSVGTGIGGTFESFGDISPETTETTEETPT